MSQFLKNYEIKADSQRIKDSNKERVNQNDFDSLEWLFPETTMNFEKLTLAFKGFCAYSLSQKHFILLPSNTNIGVLQYNNNFYVFSSKKVAYEFVKNIQG